MGNIFSYTVKKVIIMQEKQVSRIPGLRTKANSKRLIIKRNIINYTVNTYKLCVS